MYQRLFSNAEKQAAWHFPRHISIWGNSVNAYVLPAFSPPLELCLKAIEKFSISPYHIRHNTGHLLECILTVMEHPPDK